MCPEPGPDPAAGRLLPETRRGWIALMRELGIRPSKGYGQNFLVDRGVVERIVHDAGVDRGDLVVEIGPGLGILTRELLSAAGAVVAVELDRTLWPHLRLTFGGDPRFRLVEGDALEVDFGVILQPGEPWMVVANLPYSAGAAILRRLLELHQPPGRIAVMLQREVAERIVAQPPGMSVLGVACQFYADTRIAFPVPPEVFVPPPTVDSAVVILDVRREPPLPPHDRELFFRIVNAGFQQKRKQVANSLSAALGLPKEQVTAWLVASGIEPDRRAQTLGVAEWVTLARNAPSGVAS